jgi:hypothetical protein
MSDQVKSLNSFGMIIVDKDFNQNVNARWQYFGISSLTEATASNDEYSSPDSSDNSPQVVGISPMSKAFRDREAEQSVSSKAYYIKNTGTDFLVIEKDSTLDEDSMEEMFMGPFSTEDEANLFLRKIRNLNHWED